ncbi:toll/interleukin-1 receptor domain-containing protein [Actinoplanes sp. NEAU-A12]|uniref:Toll/interleukin-1 receptor domain-containing protein n=1 Tax=Actinoplanes sandaracinus TaxID=3045177 RepID=A0ABT6WEK8_9ACTN|nr:toll/interleukin-1 receptor domain-containing protein [Actinoplanes sandaracinus]MDI6098173.1 toll/interleukin-1 receptor domain-containing protein [Actinoplanes sandaracinus]
MTDFFVSYRTADQAVTAVYLKHVLSERFGARRVFLDNTAIPLGEHFPPLIEKALERCRVLIAVIGPKWLAADEHGHRRVDDPADWVRREIARALDRGIPVIPLLVGDVELDVADLPAELASLASRQYLQIRLRALEHDVEPLIDRLVELVEEGPEGREASGSAPAAGGVANNFYGHTDARHSTFGNQYN